MYKIILQIFVLVSFSMTITNLKQFALFPLDSRSKIDHIDTVWIIQKLLITKSERGELCVAILQFGTRFYKTANSSHLSPERLSLLIIARFSWFKLSELTIENVYNNITNKKNSDLFVSRERCLSIINS